jgi:hypothetical protein
MPLPGREILAYAGNREGVEHLKEEEIRGQIKVKYR